VQSAVSLGGAVEVTKATAGGFRSEYGQNSPTPEDRYRQERQRAATPEQQRSGDRKVGGRARQTRPPPFIACPLALLFAVFCLVASTSNPPLPSPPHGRRRNSKKCESKRKRSKKSLSLALLVVPPPLSQPPLSQPPRITGEGMRSIFLLRSPGRTRRMP